MLPLAPAGRLRENYGRPSTYLELQMLVHTQNSGGKAMRAMNCSLSSSASTSSGLLVLTYSMERQPFGKLEIDASSGGK